MREDGVCVSEFGRVELAAAFHRRWREKVWNHAEYLTALAQFRQDDLAGFWTWLPVDAEVLRGAAQLYETLPQTVFLRSSDCLHLATAFQHRFEEIYTFDAHQAQAASAVGLKPVEI